MFPSSASLAPSPFLSSFKCPYSLRKLIEWKNGDWHLRRKGAERDA